MEGKSTHSHQLLLVLLHESWIYVDLSGGQGRCSNELQRRIAKDCNQHHDFYHEIVGHLPDQFPSKPQERFLKVVVGLGRNLEILNVLLSVERHLAGLHFSLLKDVKYQCRNHTADSEQPTFTSTLLPQRTMGIFSHTRSKSRCQLGTFL